MLENISRRSFITAVTATVAGSVAAAGSYMAAGVAPVVAAEAIPGLYAVGGMAGGWKGRINSGCGQALGWTYTGGLLAARHILAC